MGLGQWNIDLFRFINNLGVQYEYLNPLWVFITQYTVYIMAVGMVITWFIRTSSRTRMMLISAGLAVMLAEIAGKGAGLLHFNYQPFIELENVNQLIDKHAGNSFPSDHTIVFFSCCMTFWLYNRKSGWAWLVLACGVALSRVWVGVHYPADVMTGALIGIAGALAAYRIVPKVGLIRKLLAAYEKKERPEVQS